MGLIQLCPISCIARLLRFAPHLHPLFLQGFTRAPIHSVTHLAGCLFMYVLHDKLKGKADLYIFTCPSECHIHTCTRDLQTTSIWHCMAEAGVSGKGTPQLHGPFPSPLITFMPNCLVCPARGVLCVGGPDVWPSCFVRVSVVSS